MHSHRLATAALSTLLIATTSSCARHASALRLPANVEARIEKGAFTIALPLADSALAWLEQGRPFHWRIHAGAANLSYELERETIARNAPARERLVQGVVSRCESQGHMLICGWRLPTRAALDGDRLVVTVRDPEVAGLLHTAPPSEIAIGTWQLARRVRYERVPTLWIP